MSNRDDYRISINDKDELLINLYRYARDNAEEFDRLIALTPYSQAEHREAMSICKNPDGHSTKRKAWAYYVNIQMSFAHQLNNGWGMGVRSEDWAATWQARSRRIPDILQRFQDVSIGCEDALDFIRRWNSPQTLFYLDPPYPNTNQGHYDGYTMDDWAALCKLLDEIDGSYVLSNYPQAIQPQSAQQRIEIKTTCSASGQGKTGKRNKSRKPTAAELGERERTEVLWVCDRSSAMRDDLKRVCRKQDQMSLLDMLAG